MDSLALLKHQIASARRELAGVMADVTQEMADWTPPGVANSIMTMAVHTLVAQDRTIQLRINGGTMLLDHWAPRLNVPPGFRLLEDPPEAMKVDLGVLREYWHAIDDATDGFLTTLTGATELDRTVQGMRGPTVLGHLLSGILVTHVYSHVGEISTLKGIQGARGYAAG